MGLRVLSVDDFKSRTNKVVYEEFDGLGIKPCERCGLFSSRRLDELKRFCEDNPNYHIISLMGKQFYYNKPVAGAALYSLAQGDADPELVGVAKTDHIAAFELLD